MSKKIEDRGRRKHLHSERKNVLVAKALAQKIGYLHEENLPGSTHLDALPRHSFHPDQIIKCRNALCYVIGGSVQIRHHGHFVKRLRTGALFGDMALIGQAMLGCEAVAGVEGL